MYAIQEVSDLDLAFPANVMHLTPAYKDISDDFKRNGKWNQIFNKWFFSGLPKETKFIPNEGVDASKAMRHIRCVMGSFQPKHEHKSAAISFLLSEWFTDIEIPETKNC